MKRRFLLFVLLCCAPLSASGYESNFGRVILAEADLIVQGIAGAERQRIGGSLRAEITIQKTLHGRTDARDVSVYFSDGGILEQGKAVRALFALKAMAGGGYRLVGKPILTPEDDEEQATKLAVCRAFLEMESEPAGPERARAFWDLLMTHLRQGGYPAENAAVELLFVARDRADMLTIERFQELKGIHKNAPPGRSEQTRSDVGLALQGMVEIRIKALMFRAIRRGDDDADKREAATALIELVREYPRAFNDRDADLVDAMLERAADGDLKASLQDLARAIRLRDIDREE